MGGWGGEVGGVGCLGVGGSWIGFGDCGVFGSGLLFVGN